METVVGGGEEAMRKERNEGDEKMQLTDSMEEARRESTNHYCIGWWDVKRKQQ